MIKPHCEHFNPNPVDDRICAWWDFGFGAEADTEGFCSRPDWEERVCETGGQRNIWEDGLSGPVGINVARLLGIKLPEITSAEPETCSFFKPSPLASWLCLRWIMPDNNPRAVTQFEPFCSADLECETQGLTPEGRLLSNVANLDTETED